MLKQQNKIAALYCRLSRDDEYQGDSMSIQHQKEYLLNYAKDNGYPHTEYYVDDGYSGTNYNRPDFQRMISDIESGKIGAVIVKDLSRLGREYLQTGYYTEIFFPQNDVRFIAVNDNFDSEVGDNEFAPFKNIINEWYAKDLSKKIRAVMKMKAEKGESLGGHAPYGYDKIPPENKRLIPNERAEVVKMMYQMILEGKSASDVVRKLNEMKLPIPQADYYLKHNLESSPYFPKYPYSWAKTMVVSILSNPIYTGKTVLLKTTRKSLKSKKRSFRSEDEWITVENTHEALVSEKDYETVLERISSKSRSFQANPDNIFRGLVYCAECGCRLAYSKKKTKNSIGFYNCATFKRYGKEYCTNHYITFENLYKVVLSDVQRLALLSKDNLDKYSEILMKASVGKSENESLKLAKELEKAEKRVKELNVLLQKIYEDAVFKRISEERYQFMSENMENEISQLKSKISEITGKKSKITSDNKNFHEFAELIGKYTDISELDFELVHTLIDKICVHAPVYTDGKKSIKIDIYYRFIGKTEDGENATVAVTRKRKV